VTPIAYDLEHHGRWSIDFESLEDALGPRTRAVLIVSPNNPTGSFVSRGDLDRLAAVCAEQRIAVIADEVFADYELEPGAVLRAGRAAARDDALTFALGGLSKSVGLPQVKLGWIVVGGPDHLADAALARLELVCDTYLSVSTPAQLAAAELLERGTAVREQIAARVRANHRQLAALVADVPSCRLLHAEGGWYGVVQVPSLDSEEELVLTLLRDRGVLAHPGYFFDFARESFLIVSLLPPEPVFRDGVNRVLRHFDCTASTSD
jgi:aspartate/methionine/tyrosine aminotransferase